MTIFKKQLNFLKQKPSQAQAGFTLIELMVSLMLFTIVVLAAVGSLYTVNSASKKTQAMRSVVDNLNFAIESMSRTVRTSNTVVCGGVSNTSSLDPITSADPNCPFNSENPSSKLLVDSTLGADQLVEYQLSLSGAIEKRIRESGIWTNWVPITAPEINVTKLHFYVDGAKATDDIQPNTMIFIQGVATTAEETAPFAVQTYLSQRAVE